jgi:ABC-type antimicrobial peptide transport system permease subunit
VAPALWAVLGAVGLVLVIACANVASLQLARTTDRSREFAVRRALGANRRHIARSLLIESGMLASVGAVGGIAVGWAATRYAAALAPRELPRFDEVTLDARVLAFTIVISTITAIAVGLLPAWLSARVDVNEALKRGTDRATSTRGRLRTPVIAVEIAMAFALASAGRSCERWSGWSASTPATTRTMS